MNDPFDRKRTPASVSRSEEDDARSSSKHRAALEALFAPRPPAAPTEPAASERPSKKMVAVPSREDPRGPEREKRLAKLLAAEGRAAVTKSAEDFVRAGFEFPDEQEVLLQLLDHSDEDRVRAALEGLEKLLGEAPPQRRTVLEARLRRLEDGADDEDVRTLAGTLRRRLLSRPGR